MGEHDPGFGVPSAVTTGGPRVKYRANSIPNGIAGGLDQPESPHTSLEGRMPGRFRVEHHLKGTERTSLMHGEEVPKGAPLLARQEDTPVVTRAWRTLSPSAHSAPT